MNLSRRRFLAMGAASAPAFACSFRPYEGLWTKHPESSSGRFRVVLLDHAGYIDSNGQMVIAPRYLPRINDASEGDFFDGWARVSTGRWSGFIDENGQGQDIRIDSYRFSEGLAAHRSQQGPTHIIDADGQRIGSVTGSVGEFHEGLAPWFVPPLPHTRMPFRGYVDRTGKVVIEARFAWAGPFSDGLAAVALDGKCTVDGWRGLPLPAPSALTRFTSCGLKPADSVTASCSHGYIDRTGRFVIPAKFARARPFIEGRAAVQHPFQWGFIDREGNPAVRAQFEEVQDFSEGMAAVRFRGLWGDIDRSGRIAVPVRFQKALPFSQGLAAVSDGAGFHYIDPSGKQGLPGRYLDATPFVRGLAHVRTTQSGFSWIHREGKTVYSYDWPNASRWMR